jgi:hypothetical protein
MRKHGWEAPEPESKHPYRDSAIIYGVLAVLVVVIASLTGGSIVKGVIAGVAFFAAATAWNWWRFREKEKVRRREEGER